VLETSFVLLAPVLKSSGVPFCCKITTADFEQTPKSAIILISTNKGSKMTKLTAVVLADNETWTAIQDCKIVINAKYDGYDLDTEGCETISIEHLLELYKNNTLVGE
jgi:hypothetical protein